MFDTLELYIGKEISLETLARQLVGFGYRRQEKIGELGEFSVRGGTVDIFPADFSFPIRLGFDDETLNELYAFDPVTGQKLEPHQMVILLPVKTGHRPEKPRPPIIGRELPMDPFVDIETGDFVVHVLHGIARYRGMGLLKDHLALEFADKNVLYVPVREARLVQRYVAFGKLRPKLSRLGTKGWQRLKDKTRKGVLSFASELLNIQIKRKALEGFRFQKDTDWQKKLEEEFPYEETEDQVRAIAEVKRDMESSVPMDRLLCGDVGYGKTEVALRAAFKAVISGKQVALLVPTTILAEQH